jgi:hypothetical protein
MDVEAILAIILIFGGGTVVALAMSPIGRALAARIQGGPLRGDGEELRRVVDGQQAVLEEVEGLRRDLSELQERVDFAERLLARQRDAGRLAGPGNEAR